jgi:hypothetical protein
LAVAKALAARGRHGRAAPGEMDKQAIFSGFSRHLMHGSLAARRSSGQTAAVVLKPSHSFRSITGRFGALIALAAALTSGCRFAARVNGGSGGAGGGGSGGVGAGGSGATPGSALADLVSLRVGPVMATVTITDGVAATQPFTATGTFRDGHEEDVTTRVDWTSADTRRATLSTAGLATTSTLLGGHVLVTARNGTLQASATLTVRLQLAIVDPAATPAIAATPAAPFSGPVAAARAPALVYPNDGVLLPPNLGKVEIHFRPGSASNTLYEIGFANDVTDVRVYTRCEPLADGCLYETAPAVWTALAETNRGAQAVALTVRGTDDAGTAVGASAPFQIRWARDPLQGALYYWTTTDPVGILRWNFGDAQQTSAERVVGPEAGDGQCLGCHALSRDGSKMVMTSGADDVGQLLLFDPARKTALKPFPLPGRSWFEAWNADGSAFVGVNGAGGFKDLLLFDGTTGQKTGSIPLGGAQATHPDWSQDGNRIVFTEVGSVHDDQTPGMGGISYVEQQGGAWSALRRLVPAQPGQNRYYPTVGPDNATVVFNQSTCPAGRTYDRMCDGDVDPSARLWAAVLPAAGAAGAAPALPVELAAANAPGVTDAGATDLTTTYARWSPFAFRLSEQQGLFWVSFSSSRQYGLRGPVQTGEHHGNPTGLLIWMSGVDPQQVAAGKDGSFPAFCLPFQALTTSNHIAQWTSGVPVVQ